MFMHVAICSLYALVPFIGRKAATCRFSGLNGSVDAVTAALEMLQTQQIQKGIRPSLTVALSDKNDICIGGIYRPSSATKRCQ